MRKTGARGEEQGTRSKWQGASDKAKSRTLSPVPCPLLFKYIATLGFIGFIPFAPGTFGSAAGFLFILFAKPGDTTLFVLSLFVFLFGWHASHRAEKLLGKDSGHIVIDELCGYFISVLFIPKSIGYLIAALILFRFFDILKPPPVRNIERAFSGGAGVMLDDVTAGIYANVCLQIWRHFQLV